MKSKEERKAERLRKDAELKAKYDARIAEIKATHERRMGEIRARSEARRQPPPLDAGLDVDAPGPTVYTPSALGDVAATFIPGVGVFQAVKSFRSEKAVLDSLSPEERAARVRRYPYGSSSG